MGRPAFEITDEVLSKVEDLAGKGLSRDQIAWSLGIAPGTLYRKKKENSELSDAIKKGESNGLEEITNALYKNAKKGNVTAQIFYLKCRSQSQWNDRPHESEEGYVEPVKVEVLSVDGRKQNGANRQSDTD